MNFTKATAIFTNVVGAGLMAASIQTTIPAEFVADDSDPIVTKDFDVQPYAVTISRITSLDNMVITGKAPAHRAKSPCAESYRIIGFTDTSFSTFRGVHTRCNL